MDKRRSYLILTIVLLAGIGLSLFLYRKTGGFVVLIIPIIGIGGSLFSRVLRRRPEHRGTTRHGAAHRGEEETVYDDYKYRVRYNVESEKDDDSGDSGS
jgi:hypothetical protein